MYRSQYVDASFSEVKGREIFSDPSKVRNGFG
jgi:hypothetical protein